MHGSLSATVEHKLLVVLKLLMPAIQHVCHRVTLSPQVEQQLDLVLFEAERECIHGCNMVLHLQH